MAVRFIDEGELRVVSGPGGNGCVSFRREKYIPRGGPDGGDGGRGGHIVLRADPNVQTLLDFLGRPIFKAQKGAAGSGKNCTGGDGSDLTLKLPVGTAVLDATDGSMVVDLTEAEQTVIVARGGSGGRGNLSYVTSTHQAPREFTPGEPGIERYFRLELKLIADVGLLGLPNAGKSTFLSRVSRAHPKIADYPFTTLKPQLGIAELDPSRRIVVADIPGLIEGASKGVGLGVSFLKHLQRTRVLVHLLDPHLRDLDGIVEDHRIIRHEVEAHSSVLASRHCMTVLNKSDLMVPEEAESLRESLQQRLGEPVALISGVSGKGLDRLMEQIWSALQQQSEPC
ncbi:MAG: GTPase ObgE [Planctomycetota bacterium]|nr:GTPase ObgE [Planctomycetota bacterium]